MTNECWLTTALLASAERSFECSNFEPSKKAGRPGLGNGPSVPPFLPRPRPAEEAA